MAEGAKVGGQRRPFYSSTYHSMSAVTRHEELVGIKGRGQPPSPSGLEFKEYPRAQRVNLPRPQMSARTLWSALENRQSTREFSPAGITLSGLAALLNPLGIITRVPGRRFRAWTETRRMYPSAGALYPIEAYVAVLDCSGLEQGIYHYNVKRNCLELLSSGSARDELVHATGETWAGEASVAIVLTAVFDRTQRKYGERGYRYILLEAGHAMQNICLVAEALQLGLCPCGGFVDHDINALLELNESVEAALYLALIGRRQAPSKPLAPKPSCDLMLAKV